MHGYDGSLYANPIIPNGMHSFISIQRTEK